ncbi:MAG: hypothetical protein AB7P37_21515 [Ramlibacter sp.]
MKSDPTYAYASQTWVSISISWPLIWETRVDQVFERQADCGFVQRAADGAQAREPAFL